MCVVNRCDNQDIIIKILVISKINILKYLLLNDRSRILDGT